MVPNSDKNMLNKSFSSHDVDLKSNQTISLRDENLIPRGDEFVRGSHGLDTGEGVSFLLSILWKLNQYYKKKKKNCI